MLGWDVGYVWPLLEGVVTNQVSRPPDSWQLVMGNPREASGSSEASGETSGLEDADQDVEVENSRGIPSVEPPPYEALENVSTNPSEQISGSSIASARNSSSEASAGHRSRRRTTATTRDRSTNTSSQRLRPPKWPHKASSVFACLSCVIGLCNVNRFSMLVYIYKGCFIFQFLLITFFIGIPILLMQMALGQYLGSGMLDMWYISPVFKGLGFAMLYLNILLGIYNAVPLSWLFIYFKDSFITLKDSYKWGKCHHYFASNGCVRALNSSAADFYGWSVPSYFHGRVLGRKPLEYQLGELKFEVAFNLCLVWLIIFVCLSRGPKTFGKVVYVFGMLPIALLMMVTMRMGQQWSEGILEIFSSPWRPVLLDTTAWGLAAREAFITWGLLACVALHVCSHNRSATNITKNLVAVAITSVVVLITSAFLFACCVNVFQKRNLSFSFTTYEEEAFVKVLKPGAWPYKNISVSSLILGMSIAPTGNLSLHSGYQVLRLATEVFPAALAVEGVRNISSFWAICFYTSMILFGFGQQVVMWYSVVESIIDINYNVLKAWHTTLTFISCNLAFLLGLPITSSIGLYIIYYIDFSVSSLWWIALMYFMMLFIVLFIRGRPYGTDQLVTIISRDLTRQAKILPFLTFIWNIVLPVSFLLMTITFLRSSTIEPSSAMGRLMENYQYWQPWAKNLNICIQVFPVLVILAVGGYQTFIIFVRKRDMSVCERLKILCCPDLPIPPNSRLSVSSSSNLSSGSSTSGCLDDPPPKYTPPPSYSTATSRMLAKQLDSQVQSSSCSIDFDTLSEDVNSAASDGVQSHSLPNSRESVSSNNNGVHQ